MPMVVNRYFCIFIFLYGIAVMPSYINRSNESIRSAFFSIKQENCLKTTFRSNIFMLGSVTLIHDVMTE